MKKLKAVIISALALTASLIVAFAPAVSANSALTYWKGVNASGAMVTDENCPVVVNSEKIVFDIGEFPESYYEEGESLKDYDAGVTATYLFENPSNYAVDMTLAFPFGTVPSYAYGAIEGEDKYTVTVNGEEVEKKTRYTLSDGDNWSGDFVTATSVSKLQDDYGTFGKIDKDSNIIRYVLSTDSRYDEFFFEIAVYSGNVAGLYMRNLNYFRHDGNGRFYGTWVKSGEKIEFYVVCNGLEPVYSYGLRQEYGGDREDVAVAVMKREEKTLREYADETFPFEESESARIDWFNIVAEALNKDISRCIYSKDAFVSDKVLCWYEYDLHFEAGEKLENSVSAPLYPAIDEGYEPPVYTYDYLLSPAQGWAEFGTLDIEVNTPYYMLNTGLFGFSKTENGYAASFSSLPGGELQFRLSTSENPQKDVNYGYYVVILSLFVLPLTGAAAVITVIVAAVKRCGRLKSGEDKHAKARKITVLVSIAVCLAVSAVTATATIVVCAGVLSSKAAVNAVVFGLAEAFDVAAGAICAVAFLRKKKDGDIS